MSNERLTVRLPEQHLEMMDLLIRLGEFSSRSEIIRLAVRDFILERSEKVTEYIKKMERMRDIQDSLQKLEEFKRR
jgi:Arc/MetJ-type ribon-helix-helix transcriptional regulator